VSRSLDFIGSGTDNWYDDYLCHNYHYQHSYDTVYLDQHYSRPSGKQQHVNCDSHQQFDGYNFTRQ
jgi:hypothetical protein